jgi:hypothetical protein
MTTTPSSANSSSCLGYTSYADAKSRKTSSTSSHAMTTKRCKQCDEPFTLGKSPLHVYCCTRCSRLSNRPLKLEENRHCLNCKVQLSGMKRFYCSDKCMKEWRWPSKQSLCKQCGKVFSTRYDKQCCSLDCNRQLHRKRNDLHALRASLKRKGLSLETYLAKLVHQDNRCALCRKPETAIINNKIKRLAVDHCHETNQVRGLLCQRCNLLLGQVGDNWLILDNAMEYLTYWHGKHGSSKVTAIQQSPSLN